MDKFEKANDLASLLEDNTMNRKESRTSNRRGDFLSTLQRSRTLITPDNKYSFNTNTGGEIVIIFFNKLKDHGRFNEPEKRNRNRQQHRYIRKLSRDEKYQPYWEPNKYGRE